MKNLTRLRLLYLYQIMVERTDEDHQLSTSDLIAILKDQYGIRTDRNAIARDFRTLQEIGYPIATIRTTQNHYYYNGRQFKTAELKILIDAVASSKFIPERESRTLIKRLAEMANKEDAKNLKNHVSVVGRVKSHNDRGYANVNLINDAINKKRKITFQYFDYDSNKKKILRHNGQYYVVSPYVLVWDGDYYYAIGYNDAKEIVENFRLDRIWHTCRVLDEESVAKPKEFDLAEYMRQTFQMFSTDKSMYVDLVCRVDMMKFLIDKFGVKVETKKIDDESFSARVYVNLSPTFYRWIFGFDGAIRIIGPKKVLDEYHAMARHALEL